MSISVLRLHNRLAHEPLLDYLEPELLDITPDSRLQAVVDPRGSQVGGTTLRGQRHTPYFPSDAVSSF